MCPRAGSPQGGGGNVGEVAGFWDVIVSKSNATNRTDDTTTADPELQVSLPTSLYQFEVRLATSSTVAAGLKIAMATTGVIQADENEPGSESDQLKTLPVENDVSISFT